MGEGNSFMDRFNNLLGGDKASYKPLKKTLEEGDQGKYKIDTEGHKNFIFVHKLRKFNQLINKGNFKGGEVLANDIYHNFRENDSLNDKEKLKYLKFFEKRIERGLKYLEKKEHSEEDFKNMKKILGYYQNIENSFEGPEEGSSGLEKSLTILFFGFLLVGVYFLLPSLTGNIVGTFVERGSNFIGAILFVVGILGIFLISKRI
jgi:hypothetical protein